MNAELDHVIICVPDLAAAAKDFLDTYGLVSVEGGRHSGHGTANRLIPLGDTYIELMSVVDPSEAKTSPMGTWAAHRAARPGADAVCLRTDDLDAVAGELGLQQMSMSRVTPDGVVLSWTLAGLKQAFNAGLPFFISWEIPDDLHPGRTRVDHPAGSLRLAGVTISGDVDALSRWTTGVEKVAVVDGEPGVSYRLEVESDDSRPGL